VRRLEVGVEGIAILIFLDEREVPVVVETR